MFTSYKEFRTRAIQSATALLETLVEMDISCDIDEMAGLQDHDNVIVFTPDYGVSHKEPTATLPAVQTNFNNLITKANSLDTAVPTQKSKEELKMPYIKEGTLFKRKDGRWEAKLMIEGKQVSVACCKLQEDVVKKLKKAIAEKNKSAKIKTEKDYTLHSWLDRWHEVYRKPLLGKELSKNTLISDVAFIKKAKQVLPDWKLKDIKADEIQKQLETMPLTRTCEGVYTILKLALSKATDRTNGFNVMTLVKKVKHERVKGRALAKDEIEKILNATNKQIEKDIINFYLNTGCRADEITDTKVDYVNLTNEPRIISGLVLTDLFGKPTHDMKLLPNEILIHGSKTKLSIRTMPILPPLRPILEKLVKNKKASDKLFGKYNYATIYKFHKEIKQKTGIRFTLKDYRHTCATNCKDAGIPIEVYHHWFGWSDDSMARKVYTHETDYDKKLSQKWASKFK